MHKLAEKINGKTDIRLSVRKVQELAHQLLVLMMIHRGWVLPFPQFDIWMNGSSNWSVVNYISELQKINGILLSGNIDATRWVGYLKSKEIAEGTEGLDLELRSECSTEAGSFYTIWPGSDHQDSDPSWTVMEEESGVAIALSLPLSTHDGGELPKPHSGRLLQAIEGLLQVTSRPWGAERRQGRMLHVDLLCQITVQKGILDVKLLHEPLGMSCKS